MQRIEDDDFEVVIMPDGSPREVLKNGGRMRVPLHMTDAAPQGVNLHDGHGGPVGHRPGFVCSTDASGRENKQRIYDAYDEAIIAAYKSPPLGAGSQDLIGEREGDLCTIDGAPGRLQRGTDGGLSCVPHQRQNASTAADARLGAYQEYEQLITNAWRG